jgi:HlyD family secretion protein
MDNTSNQHTDIAQRLGFNAKGHHGRPLRWLFGLLLIGFVIAGVLLWNPSANQSALHYKTLPATRGELTIRVTATGNLEPTNQVDVGSELSGIIDSVEVDFNDRVQQGQVLARLDTDKLEAQLLQSKAGLAAAEAKLREAQATVTETQVKLKRCEKLADNKMCSGEDLDSARAAYMRANAEAGSAKAQIAEASAKLDADQTNLAKAIIQSPINGVVLMRAVEPGQTVAASLQAPILFTLAEDLAQMELHVDVDEADVGQVREGQQATFTVDAYPDRTFQARIIQVRYGAQVVDGVVSYETLLEVDNADLSLRPGMTATAEILVERLSDVLLVPNAALRFSPPNQSKKRSSGGGSLLSKLMPRPPHPDRNQQSQQSEGEQRVWVLQDGRPVPVPVTVGLSDGNQTQITAGELTPGTPLLVEAVGGAG